VARVAKMTSQRCDYFSRAEINTFIFMERRYPVFENNDVKTIQLPLSEDQNYALSGIKCELRVVLYVRIIKFYRPKR
jgi:hypothetical protein